jgi:hypothetical protein
MRGELDCAAALRGGSHHDVLQPGDLHSKRSDAMFACDALQRRLDEIAEAVTSQPTTREGEYAGIEAVALGIRIESDEFLFGQRAAHIETGRGHQPQFAGNRIDPKRRFAAAKQAQDRGGTGNRGSLCGRWRAIVIHSVY